MSEEPLFDPTLKKKKKKKAVAFNEDPLGAEADPTYEAAAEAAANAPTVHEQMKVNGSIENGKVEEESAPAPPEDDFATFDLKKKKKKKIPMDLVDPVPVDQPEPTVVPTPPPAADGDATPALDDFDLSDVKKRKRSTKKKAQMDLEAFEKELGAEKTKDGDEAGDGLGEDEDLGDDPFAAEDAAPVVGINTGKEPWIGSDRDYKYTELLNRFFAALHAANPTLASSLGKRYTIAPPQIVRDGNKKSIFANITDICRRMHRQPEHVIAFMLAEMGTTGSVDGGGRLVIKGRFMPKQVENVLRRYIVEYVTCKTCKSPDTILTKENRIYFMSCESCGSRRSVSAIKSGFQAQVGKRKKTAT